MSLAISMINLTQCLEVEMTLRCKHGDLAVIVGDLPGCEGKKAVSFRCVAQLI